MTRVVFEPQLQQAQQSNGTAYDLVEAGPRVSGGESVKGEAEGDVHAGGAWWGEVRERRAGGQRSILPGDELLVVRLALFEGLRRVHPAIDHVHQGGEEPVHHTPRDGSDGIERLAPTYFVGEFLPSRPPATTITNDSTEGQMGFYYRTFARRRPCRLNEPRSGAWESACGPALRMGGKGGHG